MEDVNGGKLVMSSISALAGGKSLSELWREQRCRGSAWGCTSPTLLPVLCKNWDCGVTKPSVQVEVEFV